MIIYDDQESLLLPKQTAAVGSVTRSPYLSPETLANSSQPPSYLEATASSSHESDPLLPLPPDRRAARRLRKRTRKQIAKWFFRSIAIVIALSTFTIFVTIRSQDVEDKRSHKDRLPPIWEPITDEVLFCLPPTEWKYMEPPAGFELDLNYFSAELKFPVDTKALFFLSESKTRPNWGGSIGFTTANSQTEGAHASLIRYSQDSTSQRASNVCLLKRAKGQYGLGLLTGDGSMIDSLSLGIIISLPPTNQVKSIESSLPWLIHTFGVPNHTLQFDNVTLRTFNAPIMSDGLHSKHLDIRTTNGAVTGIYAASESLSLHNTNSFMEVDVHMNCSSDYPDAQLSLTGDESSISAKVLLSTDNDAPEAGGNISVYSSSTRGSLNLNFDSIPLNSVLRVDAFAPHGSSFLNIPRAYEGRWKISGVQRSVVLDTGSEKGDPTGLQRTRHTAWKRNGDTGNGVAWWGDEEEVAPNPSLLLLDALITINASETAYLYFW